MIKWTKFSDKCPSEIKYVWVSDFHSVWPTVPSYLDKESDYVWSEMEKYPEVPKKSLHMCSDDTGMCREFEEGFLSFTNSTERSVFIMNVRFCPFCGYEAKK